MSTITHAFLSSVLFVSRKFRSKPVTFECFIRRLPEELVLKILLMISQSNLRWSFQDVQKLSQVCRLWNDLTLTCAGFLPLVASQHTRRTNEIIVSHNTTAPLTIEWHEEAFPIQGHITETMVPALSESSRWKSLHWIGGPSSTLLTGVNTPNLSELYMYCTARLPAFFALSEVYHFGISSFARCA
jgi:hypothetical protein